MKKISKIISVLMVFLMMLSIISPVFAATEVLDSLKPDRNNAGTIENLGNQALGIAQIVCTVLAVIILMFVGVKYMMGSAQEKAEYKKTLIPYLVGAVLLFCASGIIGLIVKASENIVNSL